MSGITLISYLLCLGCRVPESGPFTHVHYQRLMITHRSLSGVPCELEVIDLYGAEDNDYERLRGYYFSQSDVCLICFSVDSPSSFADIGSKWIFEVKQHCPDVDIILVGTKADKRDESASAEPNLEYVTKEDAERFAEVIGAKKYVECTIQKPDELRTVLHEVGYSSVELENVKY